MGPSSADRMTDNADADQNALCPYSVVWIYAVR